MNRLFPAIVAASFLALVPGALRAQIVVRHAEPAAPLAERWQWATSEPRDACARGCWIAYSIQRMMEENAYTGWHTTDRDQHRTFQSLVYGREVEPTPQRGRNGRASAAGASQLVPKDVALLFRFDGPGEAIRDVGVSNIALPVDLDGLPLVWLGRAEDAESLRLLQGLYARARATETKEDLVSAIGVHGADALVVPILRGVLASGVHHDVREQAVFWLAESNGPGVLPLLDRTARGDASEDVREQAVFGISRIETDAADELLIDLARHMDDRETRETALFWLGQKASKRAVESLEAIAEDDPDVEMQKKAVFAISQLPADDGVPRLISIAQTHRNADVRHAAIFWLGESGDPRAVDVLVEIVRGR